VPLDGSDPTPLTGADTSATKPRLSPDGRRLAFLRTVDTRPQLHVIPTTGGEAERLTDLPLGVIGVRWFPDSSRLLVIGDVYADGPTLDDTRRKRDELAASKTSARTTTVAVYRYWDRWLTDGRCPHLFVIESGADPVDLTPTSQRWMRWDNTGDPTDDVDISPDGSEVAACFDVSTSPHRELRWSLFGIDVITRREQEFTPDVSGHVSAPRYSDDGRYLLYGRTIDPHFYADRVRLTRVERSNGSTGELAEGWDRSPSAWTIVGDTVVAVAEESGRQPLWRIPLAGGDPQRIGDRGTLSGPVGLDDGRVVANFDSISAPPELVMVDESTITHLTTFTREALTHVDLPEIEEFHFEGGRGDRVQGWFVRPAGLEAPAPVVHMIHGGPHGSFGDTWHWRWNTPVFCGGSRAAALVNFHGSTGFGQEFAECIRGEWGELPAADIEAATDHLVMTGLADPDRVAIAGGSYGGYLVAWLISQTDRYRCAIAHSAVTSLPGMYASDITSGREYSYGAEVWDDLGRVNRWSPAAHAAGYRTPTLVIHGERDYRVPVTQGLELYGVLQAKGVDSRLVYYPDENHWILSQANSIHWYGEVEAWLAAHLT
jgi:dipeptidyl aminopeptidase/acylaminoacyl peptidase